MTKRIWTDHLDNLLRRHYPKGDLDALADRIGVSIASLKSRAHVLKLHRRVNEHKPWTQRQLDYLRRHYATMSASELKAKVGHCEKSIYNRAKEMGLKKADGYMSQFGHRVAAHPASQAVRFQKGHTPANKGKRQEQFMTAEQIEHSKATRFKPGHRPHNTRPIGYERITDDGYVFIKIADDKKMVLKHRHVWQQHHGEIPRGMLVVFRDGNRLNCDISNLQLISKADNARRNTAAMTPEQRQARTDRAQETRNKTIRRDKIRLHWGLEPRTKLVKRW